MSNFVLRATHFLCHPFGPAATAYLPATAEATPVTSAKPPVPACPGSASDLEWMSLSRHRPEVNDPRAELLRLGLEHDEREREDPRDVLAWMGLEEGSHPSES